MRIFALDQASYKTGYALFDGIDLVRWGHLDAKRCDTTHERVEDMMTLINNLIVKIHPHKVIFEDVQLQGSPQTLILLARIQGAIINCCTANGIPYKMYLPTKWRSIIGIKQGKGEGRKRADLKEQAIAFVREAYEINIGDDCAESITIGLAYLKENELLPSLDNLKRSRKGQHTEYREIKETDFKEKNNG